MRKALFTLLLSCVLVLVCGAAALAVDDSQSYLFDLSVDGGNKAAVQVGDIVTVTLTLSRTDTSGAYQMYAAQDEIVFDATRFSYVADSLNITAAGFTGSTRQQADGSLKILMNAYSGASNGDTLSNDLIIGSFQLRARADGTSHVSSTDYKMSTASGMDVYKSAAADLQLVVGADPDDPKDDDPKKDTDREDKPTTEVASRFADVTASHWAYDYVEYLARRGVVNGKSPSLFGPNDPVTRAEFVTMLARLSGAALPAYGGQFTDVSANSYYASAVAWALTTGVTKGASATTFSPDKLVSRQEIAAMLYRYAVSQGVDLPNNGEARSFSDQAQIHSYAVEPVAAMAQAGLISGYPDGSFRPLGNATRAEAAKMLALIGGYTD